MLAKWYNYGYTIYYTTKRSWGSLRVIKTKDFKKWSKHEKLSDQSLSKAISEIEAGLIDAHLGGGLIKKRVAIGSSGKSGGVRTIIAYQKGQKAFFIYGFKKNEMSNISDIELRALRRLGEVLIGLSDLEINQAILIDQLFEVNYEEAKK
jgi:hypothetical protein